MLAAPSPPPVQFRTYHVLAVRAQRAKKWESKKNRAAETDWKQKGELKINF